MEEVVVVVVVVVAMDAELQEAAQSDSSLNHAAVEDEEATVGVGSPFHVGVVGVLAVVAVAVAVVDATDHTSADHISTARGPPVKGWAPVPVPFGAENSTFA